MFIPDQDPKHLKRPNSFFCSNYRFCTKPQMPTWQLHSPKHTLVLIDPDKPSPLHISPKFPQTFSEIFLWKCCIVPRHITVGRNATQYHCFIFWQQTPTLSLLLKVREIFQLHHILCDLLCIASSYTFFFKLLLGVLVFNANKICVICYCSQHFLCNICFPVSRASASRNEHTVC